MTESQQLGLALVLVYASECLVWARRGGVVFRRWLSRHGVLRTGGELFRNERGGLFWAPPLPAFGETCVVRGLPWSVGPEGILTGQGASVDPAGRPVSPVVFRKWESIGEPRFIGRTLWVGDERLGEAGSEHEAARLAGWIGEVRRLDPGPRARRLGDWVAGQFDTAEAVRRLEEGRRVTRGLRRAGSLLFFYLFGAVPTVVWAWGWLPALWILVPLLTGQTAWIGWQARRGHIQLYPGATEERFRLTLTLALSPLAAIRAGDTLFRPLLEEFHPVVAGAFWVEREELERLARRMWRDLRWPRLPVCPVPEGKATEAFHREGVRAALEDWARGLGMDPAAWERPLPPSDPSHTRQCPRCETQFTSQASRCAECGGRELVPLAG